MEQFQEAMLFCQSLETTIRGVDIYNKLSNYFDDHGIPKPTLYCVLQLVPFAMMGKNTASYSIQHKYSIKFLKDDNRSLLIVHCVIHRENLATNHVAPTLHEVLYFAIKCINFNKANSKREHLFPNFCEVNHSNHVRLLFYTQVRWLSK